MPTRGRQQWAREAVAMFEAQAYHEKELIIADDIEDPSFPDGINRRNIYYSRATRRPLGAKRNLANSWATGQIIMHWDSDDIYTPDRMEHQVSLLLASGTDLIGYYAMPFVESDGLMRRGEYRGFPDYCIGVSFTYWRDAWERNPFPCDREVCEDNEFRDRLTSKAFDSEGRITIRVHSGNSCGKRDAIDKNVFPYRIAAA